MTGSPHNPRTDRLVLSVLRNFEITLDLRREDLLFPGLSGNKYRKLKYNLMQAREQGARQLLTFGGAYSNHIHVTAAAGKAFGFETVGLIRGEELATQPLNPTLADAQEMGMKLVFTSRQDYGRRHESEYLQALAADYPDAYILPEGGTNSLAIKGCSEILQPGDSNYDFACCSVGTGGTMLGLQEAGLLPVWGYAALKGLSDPALTGSEITLRTGYHFGGYGKITDELVAFIQAVYEETGVVLDGVYTGKMLYGICTDIQEGVIPPGTSILAIHTGGVQGNRGLNAGLQKKGLTLLPL